MNDPREQAEINKYKRQIRESIEDRGGDPNENRLAIPDGMTLAAIRKFAATMTASPKEMSPGNAFSAAKSEYEDDLRAIDDNDPHYLATAGTVKVDVNG